MKFALLLLSFCCCLPTVAVADIWLCVAANGRQSIQDKACLKGAQTKSRVSDQPRRAAPAASSSAAAGKPAIEVGLQRNKVVICKLLDSEKTDALAQIKGSLTAFPGEDPKDNLVKIEKQRTRVGCDAS